jgi:hypothetical protein
LTPKPQPERKPLARPWVAIVITAVLLALTVQDQLSSASIDTPLLMADVLLALFWAGQSVDGFLSRYLGR